MPLTISTQVSPLLIRSATPTVVEPGTYITLSLYFMSEVAVNIHTASFDLPEHIKLIDNALEELLPFKLQANKALEIELEFATSEQIETFGFMTTQIEFSYKGQTKEQPLVILCKNWVAAYKKIVAPYPEPLEDEPRQRIIDFINYDLSNANIIFARVKDTLEDFCNIIIDDNGAAAIEEELAIVKPDPPLSDETYDAVKQRRMSFFGVTGVIAQAIEECEASDNVFTANGIQDVDSEEREVS